MKIGIYDPYLDDGGGGEKYMMNIASCLSGENDVTFFWDNKEDYEMVVKRFSIDASRITLSPNIFSKSVSFFKRALESRKYDTLIVHSDGSIPFVFSSKLYLHIQRPIEGAGKGLKNKVKLARVNKVFCNSYFTKSFVDHEVGVNSEVIYPPVDLHPKKVRKENIILHVGRFRVVDATNGAKDYKKQYIMIDTFRRMFKKGFLGWKFVLAVSVKEEDVDAFEKLKKEAKGLPIEFLINKTNDELWDIYSKSKIYWHASGYGENLDKHPEAAEHFGISTVEAMGAGVVPVVINAGGQKEIVENGLSGFLWDTLDELEERTLMLSSEDVLLDKMSSEAKKRARDFAGDRFSQEIKKLVNV